MMLTLVDVRGWLFLLLSSSYFYHSVFMPSLWWQNCYIVWFVSFGDLCGICLIAIHNFGNLDENHVPNTITAMQCKLVWFLRTWHVTQLVNPYICVMGSHCWHDSLCLGLENCGDLRQIIVLRDTLTTEHHCIETVWFTPTPRRCSDACNTTLLLVVVCHGEWAAPEDAGKKDCVSNMLVCC